MQLEPVALPGTQPFWAGADQEKLIIQRCLDCGEYYFPPSPICPACSSRNVSWEEVSGRATLYSVSLTMGAWPHWKHEGLMPVASVALEEGPRLLSVIVDCPPTPEALVIDMPLVATWRTFGEREKMLCFKPAQSEGAA